jgi:hypothetical protein
MVQCWAVNSKKKRCPYEAREGIDFCHVHDPLGKWRRQRPTYVVERWVEPPAPVDVGEQLDLFAV